MNNCEKVKLKLPCFGKPEPHKIVQHENTKKQNELSKYSQNYAKMNPKRCESN